MNQKTISLNCCILFAVLVGLSLAPLGCAPTLVGQNAAVYSLGKLHARVDSDMNPVYEASVKALEKLEVTVTDKRMDGAAARVCGQTSDNHIITIKIDPETDESTLLSIHTGVIADEVRARVIFSEIRYILGSAGNG